MNYKQKIKNNPKKSLNNNLFLINKRKKINFKKNNKILHKKFQNKELI